MATRHPEDGPLDPDPIGAAADSNGDAGAQPGLETEHDPQRIRQALETARQQAGPPMLPPESGQPEVFIGSAEGVTTYAGFNGDPRSAAAKRWALAELGRLRAGDPAEPPLPD
jgi:hypothetical protein